MMRMIGLAILTMLLAATQAVAQERVDPRVETFRGSQNDGSDDAPRLDDLRPIEQGIEDINPLRTTLRWLPTNLAVPTGFSQVFPVPGQPGWFMRINGGLYAVFRRSEYGDPADEEENGISVPEGTVFHIGPPIFADEHGLPFSVFDGPMRELPPSGDSVQPLVVMNAFRRPPGNEVTSVRNSFRGPVGLATPSIASNESYRRERLIALMQRAAADE